MNNKILIALIVALLVVVGLIGAFCLSLDSTFTPWMDGGAYQATFDERSKEAYPLIVEAKETFTGSIVFRARYVSFPRYPNEAFWFYSYHGISSEYYEKRHRELKAEGYYLAYHQALETKGGRLIHQATWIKR